MNDKMIELKPCPFCGGTDLNDDGHFVECFDCHATGPNHYPIPGKAGESWNRRHEATEPLAVLADRKGKQKVEIYYPRPLWAIHISPSNGATFYSDTYAECEAQARAYLNGLPDKGHQGRRRIR